MYRKFTADYIFNGYEILPEPAVLITDKAGTIIETVDYKDAGDGIEIYQGLLTPGFINAHCHLELSHMKGIIPEHSGLVSFVQQVMSKRASLSEVKVDSMLAAETEMYTSGIVAVGDICNTADSISVKQQRKLLWHNFIEVSGFVDAMAQYRLGETKKVYDQFQAVDIGKNTLSPHAPYSVSGKLFQLLNIETAGQLITIHNQESIAENDLYLQKNGGFLALYENFGIDISSFQSTGKSSFQSWLPYFTNRQPVISVHNVFTDAGDLAFAKNWAADTGSELFYCLCVNANRYIGQNTPPIDLLRKKKCDIVIGTDSYASNHQLNIFEEIKAIQQQSGYNFPLYEVLKWATINGAKALKLDKAIGSFEKGKLPGIVLIEGMSGLQPNQHSFARRII